MSSNTSERDTLFHQIAGFVESSIENLTNKVDISTDEYSQLISAVHNSMGEFVAKLEKQNVDGSIICKEAMQQASDFVREHLSKIQLQKTAHAEDGLGSAPPSSSSNMTISAGEPCYYSSSGEVIAEEGITFSELAARDYCALGASLTISSFFTSRSALVDSAMRRIEAHGRKTDRVFIAIDTCDFSIHSGPVDKSHKILSSIQECLADWNEMKEIEIWSEIDSLIGNQPALTAEPILTLIYDELDKAIDFGLSNKKEKLALQNFFECIYRDVMREDIPEVIVNKFFHLVKRMSICHKIEDLLKLLVVYEHAGIPFPSDKSMNSNVVFSIPRTVLFTNLFPLAFLEETLDIDSWVNHVGCKYRDFLKNNPLDQFIRNFIEKELVVDFMVQAAPHLRLLFQIGLTADNKLKCSGPIEIIYNKRYCSSPGQDSI